jgi:hypothetical protein
LSFGLADRVKFRGVTERNDRRFKDFGLFEPPNDGRVAELTREVANLRAALEGRASIEQAKGVIMAAMQCSPDDAFEVLVVQSQHENRKLRDVARDIVAAQDRRSGSSSPPATDRESRRVSPG